MLRPHPVTFRCEGACRGQHPRIADQRYCNVIAQEFAEAFPDAVKGSAEFLPGKAAAPENELLQVDAHPAQIRSIADVQELAVEKQVQKPRLKDLNLRRS